MSVKISYADPRYARSVAVFLFIAAILSYTPASSQERGENLQKKLEAAGRTIVLDGSSIHFAGNLQMNVTNFGFFGSLPKSTYAMSEVPSAQWPAGSGVEYLYAAGIWIGAESDGVPSVSTGYPETEFYPANDPVDHIYRSYEGAPGGDRPPSGDDDGDGKIDEDWLNGIDDDYDGKIDEDYSAIGKLMYSCQYSDFEQVAQQVWPEHIPLGLSVRQESYQWSEESFNDFIGVHYVIENFGNRFLAPAYVGVYADLDAGPREMGTYFKDDLIATWEGIRCAATGGIEIPQRICVTYVRDNDGDDGATNGIFGVAVLGYTSYYVGYNRPNTFRSVDIYAGQLPYERGGEPINDFQRYQSMSKQGRDEDTPDAKDYRVLLSTGPYYDLYPGGSMELDIAFVAGANLEELLDNAAQAMLIYNGIWYDRDKNPKTGVKGRETPVRGYLERFDPDACDGIEENLTIAKGDTMWQNSDCRAENEMWRQPCYKGTMTFPNFQSGNNGRESQLFWITSTAPPAPSLRGVAGDNCAMLFWDNLSELVPDAITRLYDFEGYQVYRAHDWHRPIGTTVTSGPGQELWYLLDSRDLVNGIAPDVDLRRPWAGGGFEYDPMSRMPAATRANYLTAFENGIWYDPLGKVPCPPGLTAAECDTFEALARWNLGFEGGRRYYQYIDPDAKNGLPYFYSVVASDHTFSGGKPLEVNLVDTPIANFVFVIPQSTAQAPETFREEAVCVVPNPVTAGSMAPWKLEPNNADPSGDKCEFRNLPRCRSTVRIFTVSGDLVQTLAHDGSGGNGTLAWDLISRNGQNVTSGVYIFAVEPQDGRFARTIGKFVVIR